MGRIKIAKNISYDDVRKVYYVTFNYGKDPISGETKRKRVTYERKQDAIEALKLFEADKIKNNLVMPQKCTLEEYVNYWYQDIKAINCELTTLYGYRNILVNHVIPSLGKLKLQEITPEHINRYLSMLLTKKKLGKVTVKKHYALLKDVFKVAVNEEKILKNPVERVEQIKVEKEEQPVYTQEQLEKLIQLTEGTRMEIVIKLAGLLGLRREEIAGLKWDKIDFKKKEIKITEVRTQAGKNTIVKGAKTSCSSRTLYMPAEIEQVLLRLLDEQKINKKHLGQHYTESGYVMVWEGGRPYRPNYISDLFLKIIRKNDLPYIKLHGLRHSFASIANDLGVSLYDISKALGHSEVGTTGRVYTHMFDKKNQRAINTVADAFQKPKE